MKIFVTGGGGFIGSNLISSIGDEHEIICFGHGNYYQMLQKTFGKNVKLVDGEITNNKQVSKEMKDADAVVHFAGPAGNNMCMKDPARATLSHAVGTHIVLTEAINNGVERFLFASTQSVYTTYKKRPMPFTEDMSLEPDDLYGALKTMAEYEIRDSDINYTILRFANVYGYGNGLFVEKTGGAIGNFIKAALTGSELSIYGTGEQGIDYVSIKDVCNAVKAVIGNSSIRNEIFNVGSGRLITIAQLANKVADLTKNKLKANLKIKNLPAPEGSIWPDRLMSIERINKKIDWEPAISLDDGISEILSKSGAMR
ncbi:MAG: NAD-dependent epimerase/dehydratase family protein [Candidatus Aenigmarchaeota archaeon]|nr:NAD-dependent epimerase/dehydratase family protein [Candidatus Aenigmarchaeota archaeon]